MESYQFSFSILCLFFNATSVTKLLERLSLIGETLGLIKNIELIETLTVNKHVHYTQKTSILSDMYGCLNKILNQNDNDFESFIKTAAAELDVIISPNDILSNLYLYSFKLRQKLVDF